MPFALEFVPEIADAVTFAGLSGVVAGSVAQYCDSSQECNSKRDIIDMRSVPKMRIERQAVGPCNIPMFNFDLCKSQVQGQNIVVVSSIPSPGVAQFDNVPPACMDLASVLGGSCNGDTDHPVPCGSACMQYTGLTDAQMGYLSRALKGN